MSVVRVAIPVLRGKRRFHLDKGRPWSIVEHALLFALTQKPYRAVDLAAEAKLPQRLVIELVVRLMRAGWVELRQNSAGVHFSANDRGRAAAAQDELPIVPKRMSRWMSFVVDQITGTIYRPRELPPFEKHVLDERGKTEPILWIGQPDRDIDAPLGEIVGSLFHDDEQFVGIDPAGDRFVHRFALATVRDGQIEGLTKRAPERLREAVLKATRDNVPKLGATVTAFQAPRPSIQEGAVSEPIQAMFAQEDIILGGAAHQTILEEMLKRARHRVIIHSTFISPESFHHWLPKMVESIQRGTKVDILWGESDDKEEINKTRRDVQILRATLAEKGLADSIRLHGFTTGSHAKFIIADNGRADRFTGVLGSCNWLSSNYGSFEASARLRDPALLGLLAGQLVELSRGTSGHWNELNSDFLRLAATIARAPKPSGPKALVAIILGSAHKHYVREARDNSTRDIFVTSHRFGAGARQAIIVPALKAAEARNIRTLVFYGKASGKGAVNRVTREAMGNAGAGIHIRAVHNPRLHAKILAWDDDNLVLTSQNWLSADPSDADPRREIGVFIKSAGVARAVKERFDAIKVS